MDFALSEFQQLLKEQAERFIERDYGFEQRRALVGSATGYSEAHWQTFAALGWLGLPFSEDLGGFGGTAADLGLLFETFGHGLVVEPYLATVLGGLAVQRGGTPAQQQAITELLMQAVGPYALPYDAKVLKLGWHDTPPIGPEYAAPLAASYFDTRKTSIYGGSNEIQKNILAKAMFGL